MKKQIFITRCFKQNFSTKIADFKEKGLKETRYFGDFRAISTYFPQLISQIGDKTIRILHFSQLKIFQGKNAFLSLARALSRSLSLSFPPEIHK